MLAETLSALGSVGSAFAALLGVGLATYGALRAYHAAKREIDAWKRQLHGATEYQVARRVLQAIFRLRDGLHRTRMQDRDPFNPRGRPFGGEENHHTYILRNQEWNYSKRIETLVMDRQELLVAEQEAMVLWGEAARPPLERLYNITANMILWEERYFGIEMLRFIDEEPQRQGAEAARLETLLYIPYEGDWFERQIDSAARDAEAWYRDHLR